MAPPAEHRAPGEQPASSRILAIRFGSLGDVVLTFPALALLREQRPLARIELATRVAYAALCVAHPAVDSVVALTRRGLLADLALVSACRRRRFDTVLDFHGTPRSRLVAALSGAGERRTVSGARWARRRLVAAATFRRFSGGDRPAGGAIESAALRAARLVDPAATAETLPEPRLELPAAAREALAALDELPAPRVALAPGAAHAAFPIGAPARMCGRGPACLKKR